MSSERHLDKPRRRFAAVLVCVAYIAVSVVFLALHILGDSRWHGLGYYFTWDMFPYFYCESTRKLAVGRTASGRSLELVPGPSELYRSGTRRDLNRADLDREGNFFRGLAERAAQRVNEHDPLDPVVHVHLFERFWPAKFNLPDDMYLHWAKEEKPPVWQHWRLRGEFDVPERKSETSHRARAAENTEPSNSAVEASAGGPP